jgi:hypothetical protein
MPVDANDAVAGLKASFSCRSIFHHPADHGGGIENRRIFVVHHEDADQQKDGQHDVHGGAGDGDEEAVPAGVREEFRRIAGALVHGILAAHLDVAAERDGADAVVGISLAVAE